ncbi:MAG: YgfZ/GcvT domain-containing protein [Opitutales bacterium]
MPQFFIYQMRAHLLVTGGDAPDFLQSQFSRDLRSLEPGHGVYGLWLDVKGKIVADSWVWLEGPETFRIFSEHSAASGIVEKLERHIIADDVEIEVVEPTPALALVGVEAAQLQGSYSGLALLPGRRARVASCECLFRTVEERDAMIAELGGEPLTGPGLHALRLDAGIPLVPQEAGPGELPGEAGLDKDAVDFDKGCFLGQEVVARMHNLGKSTRALYRVTGDGVPPVVPQPLETETGKTVGELRSTSPRDAGWEGVALLKIRYADVELSLAQDGGRVRVQNYFRSGEAL